MPWEYLGACGDGQLPNEREWVVAQMQLGLTYLKGVCGEPPAGCELAITWQDHELGDYPLIGVWWDPEARTDAPWAYISRCEVALSAFDDAVNWSEISPEVILDQADEIDEDDEASDAEDSED
jgi:hypothetical protein